MRRSFGLVFLLCIISSCLMPATVNAQEYNHIITVYATVPEQRAVYLNSSGDIVKIAGNTAINITPQVYAANNKLVDMTERVSRQYQNFLSQHGAHLTAGVTYKLNPLAAQTASDNRIIQINIISLRFGSD